MDKMIIDFTSTATVAIAVFGMVFCLMQSEYSRVNGSFAMFLAAVAVNTMADAFFHIMQTLPPKVPQVAELIVWGPSTLCLAPLFWVYVVTLTSPTQQRPNRLYWHLLPAALVMMLGVAIALGPKELSILIFTDQNPPLSGGWIALILVFGLLQLTALPQVAIYLFLIVRRLMRYRVTLRDYYASTEQHELRWIYIIGGLGMLFWCASALIQFLVFDASRTTELSNTSSVAGIAGLGMVATTTLWGLRQRPPLVPDIAVDDLSKTSTHAMSAKPAEKYEKSALSPEASARIARKLRAAMEQDHLHRDPNLSLWVLARHVGASPNYISQTLSEEIGESFFDFVNRHRIAEAKTLLATTDDTVLTITYDVGFNARSSFYNAFKRVTGETPTSYRKALSQPAGMDDSAA